MNKKQLERTIDLIEYVLLKRGMKMRVTGGIVTPRVTKYNLSAQLNDRDGLSQDIAEASGSQRVSIEGNVITVARTDAPRIGLLSLLGNLARSSKMPAVTATLGVCDDGAPLLMRMNCTDVGQVMLCGAGARDLARTMVVSLAVCNPRRHVQLVLIGDGFGDLWRLPNVRLYASGVNNGAALTALAELRLALKRNAPDPHIVIVISGMDEAGPLAREMLDVFLERGHAAGIHVVAIRDAGRSSAGFQTIIKAAEPGEFTAYVANDAVRFTAATITPAEVGQIVLGALPARSPSRLQAAAALV